MHRLIFGCECCCYLAETLRATLTVIDPVVRLKLGLPIIKMNEELKYYHCKIPCGNWKFEDEVLCLWQVTPNEIVRRWEWKELVGNPNWYKDIIVPAYEQFRRKKVGSYALSGIDYTFGLMAGSVMGQD